MPNHQVFSVLALGGLLSGCSPSVDLDGTQVRSLKRAAALAEPGAIITLSEGVHQGGITLPDATSLYGAGASILTEEGRAIEGLGSLSLFDLELVGGVGDDGGAVRASGPLRLEAVQVSGASGEVAVQTSGTLTVNQSTILHNAVGLRVLSPLGRPDTVEIVDSLVTGGVDVAGDGVDIRGLEAQDVRIAGQTILLQDSALHTLETQTPSLIGTNLDVQSSAWIQGQSAVLGPVSGGTWQVDIDQLNASAWTVQAVAGRVDQAYFDTLTAPFIDIQGAFISAQVVETSDLTFSATSLDVTKVRSERATLTGFGAVSEVTVTGDSPVLTVGPAAARALVVHADSGQAFVRLEGTSVEGLLLVEAPTTVAETVIATESYADVRQFTFLGGSRDAVVPPNRSVRFYDSIIAGVDLGEIIPFEGYADTVLWHLDGSIDPALAAYPGVDPRDPEFLAPGDPRLSGQSPYFHRGAFAGSPAPLVESIWLNL